MEINAFYNEMYNFGIKSELFTFSGALLGRHGVSVPAELAAKDDLGIGCLLAVVRAGGAKGIVRRLLRNFGNNGICSDSHKKTSFQLL